MSSGIVQLNAAARERVWNLMLPSRRTLREPEEPASASRKNFSCSDSAVAE
ncbi:Uncharacterised protein [Mycobacterium tuberculosis]|uniref:Uncharacterized protein n=1 Tax=Mycobacterium tuberculosis TaxID=1773 RepID=A0A655JU32_MYCTX|nr:Uncharacterised protein [Mycobacterium tuberculosis]